MYPNVKSEVWSIKDWVTLSKGIELSEMALGHENGKPRRYSVVKNRSPSDRMLEEKCTSELD